ncbi:uncharacterized protein LOC122387521 [Amphibalanus amphitrite]|uniref:uncharacterized protein LOC122387521 n=1 Tax=Amphibalanus amphitrite TaxID=1232801 RepID=UPI001C90A416|nr:uncharacterized protein LOC122387521 [Amphibalanus amphitrite]
MEQEDTSVSPLGGINIAAKPKKSILKRSDPEPSEAPGDGAGDDGSDASKRPVPFSRIIPELSRLEEEDARLASAAAIASDLQSVSSAASLSPLSSDDEVGDKPRPDPGAKPAPPSSGRPRRRRGGNRHIPRRPPALPGAEPLSPAGREFPPRGARPMKGRSPSPARMVRYSPSPERGPPRVRPSRTPPRRSRGRRSRSRSPRRRSRSPGWYRRGPSPRHRRSPGRRRWSRSPSPRRRRSRSRSRSPPWGRNVERSLLAMSRTPGPPPPGYGPPTGPPGYPAMPYPPVAGAPPHPGFPPQPFPGMAVPMAPGPAPPFGQPMYAAPGVPRPVYVQPPGQPAQQPVPQQPTPPGASTPSSSGVPEHMDSDRRQPSVPRLLTDVQQASQTPPAGAGSLKPEKLPSEEVESAELVEVKKKSPWMTQQLLDMKNELEALRFTSFPYSDRFRKAREYQQLLNEARAKLGFAETKLKLTADGQVITLSPGTLTRLKAKQDEFLAQRDRLAGELHQLKMEQKQHGDNNVVMRNGKPVNNWELHQNLKKQGELLKALEPVSGILAQLRQLLDPFCAKLEKGIITDVGQALVKQAQDEAEDDDAASTPTPTAATSKSEVSYLLLGDETLAAVQVYIREQESRASFGSELPPGRIRLVSRPDVEFSSVEFRHWVRAAVRQSGAGTLVLLAGAGCLESGHTAGGWSFSRAVAPLLPLLRDLRADGLTRVVVVGLPVKLGADKDDRAAQFNAALQEQLENAGPHVPRVIYTPVMGGPKDGFGEQTEGGLTLDLYDTLRLVIEKCEQKLPKPVRLPSTADSSDANELDSLKDASEKLQDLLDGLRGRLAGDEAAGLGAVAALITKLKDRPIGADQMPKEAEEPVNLNAEDPSVFFRDPADHVCLHCTKIFLNAKTYLEHLKSEEHRKQYLTALQNVPETPWRKDIPPIEKKKKNAESKPIKGLDMFIRVECWYCKVCEMFVGDLRCASSHLKSRRHNAKYDEYLENNPSYHAVVGETRSRLLVRCAEEQEQRIRQRREEEAQKRGDRLNERMRRQSEGAVQDVTDEVGAAAGAAVAVTPPAVTKKAGIKLNLLTSSAPAPDEMGQLKRKVQANLAAEQESKKAKVETAEKEVKQAATKKEKEAEARKGKVEKAPEGPVPTVSNLPEAEAAAAAKVKITLPEKLSQKPAAGAAAVKKKAVPIVGKLPKLRVKKPEPAKPAAEPPQPPGQLSKSELATLELANRKEVLATIPRPACPPPGTTPAPAAAPAPTPTAPAVLLAPPQTEAISDDENPVSDVLDLLDIDLPDADERADADELKMLGICDEDVAAQQLPATRPPP